MTTTPEQTSPGKTPKKSWATRTTLITAVAVAGVIVASSAIGDLAATDQLVAVAPATPTAPTTSSVVTTVPTNADGTTEYAVDAAGTVKLATGPSGLILSDVSANSGWMPSASQSDPASLTVGFTNGTRAVVFTATLSSDGSITADVTEPMVANATIPQSSPTPTPSASATSRQSGERENHEYEGADDDD
jgi:hypothetical protein